MTAYAGVSPQIAEPTRTYSAATPETDDRRLTSAMNASGNVRSRPTMTPIFFIARD